MFVCSVEMVLGSLVCDRTIFGDHGDHSLRKDAWSVYPNHWKLNA